MRETDDVFGKPAAVLWIQQEHRPDRALLSPFGPLQTLFEQTDHGAEAGRDFLAHALC